MKKNSRKGGRSGKKLTIGGDLYDTCDSKNECFHNGRNLGGHILTEHPVHCNILDPLMILSFNFMYKSTQSMHFVAVGPLGN